MMSRAKFAAIWMLVGCSWSAAANAAPPAVDDLMAQDPRLVPITVATVFSPRLKTLWMEALQRPDAELRRQAAATLILARRRGMKGLEDAAPVLVGLLRDDPDVAVRRAAASALVDLDAKQHAEALAAAAERDGITTASVVEPALARWEYAPRRAVWLRIASDVDASAARRSLAVECLGLAREPSAAEPLATLVRDPTVAAPLKAAAARALGRTTDSGLASLAAEISDGGRSPRPLDRVAAALLLARQSDPPTVELLKKLVVDAEPAAARPALERLYELNPADGRAAAREALRNADANVRRSAARMIADQEDADAIRVLRPLLADRNPGLRGFVAEKFVEFGGREALRDTVLEEASRTLGEADWRGLEQAALVLGVLDHKPASKRFLQLLSHARPEVMVTAAWGLRRLRLPDTLAPALKHARTEHERNRNAGPPHYGRQLSQLFQLFGDQKYREAEPLLRQYVPKGNLDMVARGAACWALGHLYVDKPDNDLVSTFGERLADVSSSRPEFPEVRLAVAVALGRMKAKSQVELLRKFSVYDVAHPAIGLACYWSVEQITGEKPPPPDPRSIGAAGWFLEPTHD